jgi:isopenicillin N synthase-like dioxygenase
MFAFFLEGATPEMVEKPRCLRDQSILDQAAKMPLEDRPNVPQQADVKWRFFTRIGERPKMTRFKELNADPVVPAAFAGEWENLTTSWGSKLIATVHTVAEMLAVGFGLDKDIFTQRMRLGAHLLAPTGVDLEKYGSVGTVVAGYHYDLNFLTIHGKSRYPGLSIWLKNGKKVSVRIPDGCLLIQAGKQMEWLTGGVIKAGFHEVVCTEETINAAEKAKTEGRPAWRVSSTVFSQIASDEILRPLDTFATPESLEAYPPTPAGKYVEEELEAINLKSNLFDR